MVVLAKLARTMTLYAGIESGGDSDLRMIIDDCQKILGRRIW